MLHNVMRGLAAALLAGAAAAGEIAAQDAAPDYAPYTATALIPFDRDTGNALMPFTNPVVLSFRVEGRRKVLRATMDTGTTGVVISADLLPPFDTADAPPGSEFLSSSNVLWTGHWVTQDLVFLGPHGPVATARVPVLAMQWEVVCPGYDVSFGTMCPESARIAHGRDSLLICGRQPPGPCHYPYRPLRDLVYMGVGFGREEDHQPQGTPDKNPLLNIVSIGEQPVPAGSMRGGYIITAGGVQVGLTPENTAGFQFLRLQPRTVFPGDTASRIPRDWGPATVCIAIDGNTCAPGAVLVDTGVDEMFLRLPSGTTYQTDTVIDPSTCGPVQGLVPGSRVQVSFMNAEDSIAAYAFTVGNSANVMAPSVAMPRHASPTFVNTGRHLLRGFNVLLDADGGYFGVRPLVPPPGPSLNGPSKCTQSGTPGETRVRRGVGQRRGPGGAAGHEP